MGEGVVESWDEAFWARIKAGEERAFTILYRASDGRLRGFLVKKGLAHDDLEIDSICAVVWDHVLEKLSDFDPQKGSWFSWLMQAARWRAVDWHRKNKAAPEPVERPEDAGAPAWIEPEAEPGARRHCPALRAQLEAFVVSVLEEVEARYAGKSRRPAGLEHAPALVRRHFGEGLPFAEAGAPFGLTRVHSRYVCRIFSECVASHPEKAVALGAYAAYRAAGCEGLALGLGEAS